jgi:fructose-1,6-bisphosphatase/inositol monophosphatase family enzyme
LIGRPGETCWIVDPLDGTANFAAGRDRFAMIVCLVHDRATIAGWILDVPNGRMAAAAKGQGVTLDGAAVRRQAPAGRPKGLIGDRIHKEFDRQLVNGQRARLGELTTLRCAGREYIEILAGRFDFCLHRMTKPWDHAAGALMLAEAGGDAVRFNGASYRPADRIESGIIGAATPSVLTEVRAVFETVQLPLLAPRA